MIEREFKKVKHADLMDLSDEFLSSPDCKIGFTDFVNDRKSILINTFTSQLKVDDRHIIVNTEPPTFLDWLFQRSKPNKIKVEVRDILKKYPKELDDSFRITVLTEGD